MSASTVPDLWGCLDRFLQGLPEHVGLNLEVKMAMPNTCPATPPEERHTETSSRGVTFSSFDPDVCVALKSRQSREACKPQKAATQKGSACFNALNRTGRYPVVFLSGMGLYPHADARRTSIEAAINHAASAQLAGQSVSGMADDCFNLRELKY
eukprot:593778-Pelagomonas_calceolata.AAC.6